MVLHAGCLQLRREELLRARFREAKHAVACRVGGAVCAEALGILRKSCASVSSKAASTRAWAR
jgi:hypothetical protein